MGRWTRDSLGVLQKGFGVEVAVVGVGVALGVVVWDWERCERDE